VQSTAVTVQRKLKIRKRKRKETCLEFRFKCWQRCRRRDFRWKESSMSWRSCMPEKHHLDHVVDYFVKMLYPNCRIALKQLMQLCIVYSYAKHQREPTNFDLCLAAGERALPRPPGESMRGKGRREDWRRERGGLDHPRLMTARRHCNS